jgi:hypothetical protein
MKSSNYVIYLKKRMGMGKCTSCILYIKQNPTTYKETTISQRNSTYKFQQKYCYFGKTFKEQARKVHVRLNLGLC